MRVIVADDSVLLREGVARLLEEAGFEVVAQAADGEELMRKARAHKPDIAIIDIRMPPTHTDEGLQAALRDPREMPGTGVLVLSEYIEEEYALELLADDAAGVGYLLKDRVSDVDRFAEAVRSVAEGGSALDPEVVSQMLGRRRVKDAARGADAARARRAGADGRGTQQPGDRRDARDLRACGREARERASSPNSTCRRPPRTIAACWRYWRSYAASHSMAERASGAPAPPRAREARAS